MTKLAPPDRPSQATVLAVRLGDGLFAIPIEDVVEVLPALPVESTPECPSFVRGVVFVRGHLIPVLSAAERLGMADYRRPDEPHIVCLRQGERRVGVEFDEAVDLMAIELADLLPAGELGAAARFLRGLIERDGQIIRLLDPQRLMARDEAVAFSSTAMAAATEVEPSSGSSR